MTAGSGSVTLFDDVAVDAQCQRWVGMAEAAGNLTHVDAGTDQLCGREVTEVVQSHGRQTELVAHTHGTTAAAASPTSGASCGKLGPRWSGTDTE
jgi:hypothetical protein